MKSAAKTIAITSTAFSDGQPIPKKFTGDGQDLSPPLSWSCAPVETKQFALICDDPDAPTPRPWVHWVLYGVLGDVRLLREGVGSTDRIVEPKGAMQGQNSWPDGRNIGYRGPLPPKGHGVHHYHFKLYALDGEPKLEPGLSKDDLLQTIEGHVLATGEIIGTYERK